MKKICSLALLIVSLFSASFALAANLQTSASAEGGYFSTQHPLPASNEHAKKGTHQPTDIVVYNATGNIIYVEVPAGGFTDPIYPGAYDHIYNWKGAFNTQLILRGPDGTPINGRYGQVYCPRASITVYGYTLNYISVDNRFC